NTKLDADPYFGTSQQKFNLNQFGGSFGGPIKKDKTFFFLDYQAKRQREGVTFTGYTPTTSMITPDANGNYDYSNNPFGVQITNPFAEGTPFQCVPGNPSTPEPVSSTGTQAAGTACNIIPKAVVNPIGAEVVQLYASATPNATASGFNYVNSPVRKLNEGTWDIRLDHNFSAKDSAFARFSYDQATNFIPGGSPTWSEANAFGSNQNIVNHILSFGTGTCEAAKIGIPGADLGSACDSITGYPASLNQSTKDCISCGMTSFQLSTYFSVGDRAYAPYQGGTNVYSLSDTLDLIRGKHEIRFGLVYR